MARAALGLIAAGLVALATLMQNLVDFLQEPREGYSSTVRALILGSSMLTFLALFISVSRTGRGRTRWR